MGEAGAYPTSCGTISRWFPKNESTRGTSWLGIGANSGAALAPLIVIPIAEIYGWRAPFFVNAVIGLIWVLVCYLWFRNHPGEMKNITAKEKEYIENNRVFTNHNEPFPWKAAFRNPMIWTLFISYFCVQWANYFVVAWMPNYLQEGKHFSEQQMRTTMSFLYTFGIFSSFSCGIFSDWLIKIKGTTFSRRSIAMVSFAWMVLSIFISAKALNHTLITVSMISASFCIPVIVLTCFSTCVDIGGDKVSTLTGFMNCFGQLGAFAMSVIFGKIVDFTHSYEAPQFLMMGVLTWAGCAGCRLMHLKKSSRIQKYLYQLNM